MSANRIPEWSFLAVEPAVRAARAKLPREFERLLSAKHAQQRRTAFWKIFGAVEQVVQRNLPVSARSRHRLAVQTFYALVDMTAWKTAPDRDISRWLASILEMESGSVQEGIRAA